MWLRPPKARPIAGSVWSVSSRDRYMATWRGQARLPARLAETRASTETPNASAVCSWISVTVVGAPAPAQLGIEAGEHLVGELGRDGAAGERAEGDHAHERALERAHVVGDAIRDQLECRRVDVGDPVLLDALAEDRQARRRVRGADVRDQPGLEALAQAGLELAEVARQRGRR